MSISLTKIISGAQTGADIAGLDAALELGLETGGWMPNGWRTEDGPKPEYEAKYGLRQTSSRGYPPRTKRNVRDADATVIFGDIRSPGCTLTYRTCDLLKKPWGHIKLGEFNMEDAFIAFLRKYDPIVLNIAGNREKGQGIYIFTKDFLVGALREVL